MTLAPFTATHSVSSLGRVRTVDRNSPYVGGRGHVYHDRMIRARILRGTDAHNGYRRVHLADGAGAKAHAYVHRLVALAFLGVPPDGKEHVNHKDGNPANNAVANLEWCCARENLTHSARTKARGLSVASCRDFLGENDAMMARRAAGERVVDIARSYALSAARASIISRGLAAGRARPS